MTTQSLGILPAARDWLLGPGSGRALIVGRAGASMAHSLHRSDRPLTVMDRTREGVQALLRRAPAAVGLVAAAETLPLAPAAFDAVVVVQGLHLLAPGLALPEFARVLRPGGRLCLTYTVRDDSVPWVRRLAALLRGTDPRAMTGDYGDASVSAVADSPYFQRLEQRSFRLWHPVTEAGLLAMVSRSPAVAALGEEPRAALLAEVSALYAGAARVPEPLLLPYSVRCWRAEVDHTELSAPLTLPEAGLQILL